MPGRPPGQGTTGKAGTGQGAWLPTEVESRVDGCWERKPTLDQGLASFCHHCLPTRPSHSQFTDEKTEAQKAHSNWHRAGIHTQVWLSKTPVLVPGVGRWRPGTSVH